MGSQLEPRDRRARPVLANALTKPVNVLVPAGLLVAGFLLAVPAYLAPLAIIAYVLLAWLTVFDEAETRKVLAAERASTRDAPRELPAGTLPQRIVEPLAAAIVEESKIKEAIARANLPYTEVSTEVGVLMDEMGRVAQKGALIHSYLSDPGVVSAPSRLAILQGRGHADGPAAEARKMAIDALESQVRIQAELDEQFERSCAELEHLAASLGVVRGQIVRMSVVEDSSAEADLAREVRSLRERVSALAESLAEATLQLGRRAQA